MTIVKRIGLVETDKNDRPVDDVKIVKGSVKNAWIFIRKFIKNIILFSKDKFLNVKMCFSFLLN